MRIIFGEISKIPYQIVSISLIIVSITVHYLFKNFGTLGKQSLSFVQRWASQRFFDTSQVKSFINY
jgi:hypothetical protein